MKIRKPPHGVTLIEMVAVISVGAVVLGLCVMLTHSLLRLNRAGHARLAEGSALDRLARTFRDDVRAARRAKTVPGDAETAPARLELTMPDDLIVEYRSEAGVLVRLGRIEGEVDRIDRFSLPAHATARPEVRAEPGGTLVSLILDPRSDSRAEPALRDARIDAVLGRDRRFEREGGGH